MKTDTKCFFLRCLADFAKGVPTAQADGIDYVGLFSLAEEQDMLGVVYYQCRGWLPKEEKRLRIKPYIALAALSLARADALKELVRCTEREKIPLLFMKGAVFRDFYPVPALRSMGDADCLVRKADREALDWILCNELGFQRHVYEQAVWTYEKKKLFLEAHVHMIYEPLANNVDYQAYFDSAWEHCHPAPVLGVSSEYLLVPDESFHLLYLMAHTVKHVTNKGSGFRPYLDMALMTSRCADTLDWEWIARELEKLGLGEFTRICFGLCERWFGVEMPLKPIMPEEAFLSAATAKCFADGLFGHQNAENERADSAKKLKRSHLPRPLAALLLTVRRIFPSYREMQLVPWYSFINGRPWLTPAAWVYRWGYVLLHKKKQGAAMLTEPFAKNEAIAQREDWLRQWGL